MGDRNLYGMEVLSLQDGLMEVICRKCQLKEWVQANRFQEVSCDAPNRVGKGKD